MSGTIKTKYGVNDLVEVENNGKSYFGRVIGISGFFSEISSTGSISYLIDIEGDSSIEKEYNEDNIIASYIKKSET